MIPFDAWHGPLRAGRARRSSRQSSRRARAPTTSPDAPSCSRGSATPALTLVDARAPERWRGETEPIDPVAGRIPGRAEPLLPGRVAAAGTTCSRRPELVVYCGSGVTACAVLHELHLAGRDDARLYPGSFSEWYALGPVERG